jgi:hypothetical protein
LNLSAPNVIHEYAYYYKVEDIGNPSSNRTLILSQSFDQGWHAYNLKSENMLNKLFPFLGTELKSHTIVNNWENGWVLEPEKGNKNIVIIYLPQYFEYLGFVILILPVLIVILRFLASKKHREQPPRVDL